MLKLKQKRQTKNKVLKPKKLKRKNVKDYSGMSVDDFLNQSFDDESETEQQKTEEEVNKDEQEQFEPDDDEVETHRKSLQKLRETDPEFYKFLEENDRKLLKFDVSDEELDGEDEEQEKTHVPNSELEIASDESDYEPEDGEKVEEKGAITLKMLKQWQTDIKTDKTNQTIRNLVHAFHAALRRVSSNEDDDEVVHFKVGG